MPVITLTSDIGLQDYLVAAVKGQFMQLCPETSLVDISHQIAPFNFPQAAYLCRGAFPHFPTETFHCILVNLFDRKTNPFLLAFHEGHYFCCADNGLLTMILNGHPEQVFRLGKGNRSPANLLGVVQLFGLAVQGILSGKALDQIGEPVTEISERNNPAPTTGPDSMEGQVLFIDHYENVIVNITRDQFESQRKGRGFRIYYHREEYISRISETYWDVVEGQKLALFNTAGYLEISINKGNAAGLFGLQGSVLQQPGREAYFQRNLFYQMVKIIFE